MSRRRRGRRSRRRGVVPNQSAPPRLPKSSYREYLERCEANGREPDDFMAYLANARRWRTEYGPARDRGDFELVRELEDLLCEVPSRRRSDRPSPDHSNPPKGGAA